MGVGSEVQSIIHHGETCKSVAMAEDKKLLDYRAESRRAYTTYGNSINLTGGPSFDDNQLKTGALLRIADAQEKMAENFQTLMNERDSYFRMYLEEKNKSTQLRKQLKQHQQ